MDNTARLITTLEQPLTDPFLTPLVYQVKAGDTLSRIITRHYDVIYHSDRYRLAEASVRYFNPMITNPDKIYPGQLIQLVTLGGVGSYCPKPDEEPQQQVYQGPGHMMRPMGNDYLSRWEPAIPTIAEEQNAFWAMAWLEQNYGLLSTSTTAGFNSFGGLVSQSHNTFIADVKSAWQQYQAGNLSKGQYDYRRQKALKTYAQKIGPFEKLLLKGQTAQEAIRITRSKALPATQKIDYQLNRLSRLSTLTKHGGIVLSVAGVGMGCYQIAHTQNQHEKNEILVETLGSTIVGGFGSMALGMLLVTNPVGWVVALVLGTGAALLSYGAGKGATWVYDKKLRRYDLVNMMSVDKLCQ